MYFVGGSERASERELKEVAIFVPVSADLCSCEVVEICSSLSGLSVALYTGVNNATWRIMRSPHKCRI